MSEMAQLRHLWGEHFFDDALAAAAEEFRCYPEDAGPLQIMAAAIGKIARRLACPKCGSTENVHCLTITPGDPRPPRTLRELASMLTIELRGAKVTCLACGVCPEILDALSGKVAGCCDNPNYQVTFP